MSRRAVEAISRYAAGPGMRPLATQVRCSSASRSDEGAEVAATREPGSNVTGGSVGSTAKRSPLASIATTLELSGADTWRDRYHCPPAPTASPTPTIPPTASRRLTRARLRGCESGKPVMGEHATGCGHTEHCSGAAGSVPTCRCAPTPREQAGAPIVNV